MPSKDISIVYMVAGLSSRFGGKIKQFAQVGPDNETLIEVSMREAASAGFGKIVFVVGDKTEAPFREKFGDSFFCDGKILQIFYTKQVFDSKERDKPWGTVDAIVSAKEVVEEPFVVCNGDDIYGKNAFKTAYDFLAGTKSKSDCAAVGYELGKAIPQKGKTNRGIFSIDKEGNVLGITEVFDIEKSSLKKKGLNEKSLCSMNLFGLQREVLQMLEQQLKDFKKKNKGNRTAECLLPNELGNLIKQKKIKMKLLSTTDKWFGVTNPEDESGVREALKSVFK